MGLGVSWHWDINAHIHAVPSGAALEHGPALCHALAVCLSCLCPSVHGQCGEEEQDPDGAWCRVPAASPWCCGRGDNSLLGRWVPVPAGGSSLAPLHCSKTVTTMSSSATHRAASIQTHLLAAGHCPQVPRVEASQHGEAGRGTVQDCRLTALPHPQRSHFSVTSVPAHIILRAPGPHGPPDRCPSPAHLAAEFTGEKQCQSPASASCQLCQVPGQLPGVPRPAAMSLWGHLAPSHGQHIPWVQGGPLGDGTAALWAAGAALAAATSPASPSLRALGWLVQGHGVEGGR